MWYHWFSSHRVIVTDIYFSGFTINYYVFMGCAVISVGRWLLYGGGGFAAILLYTFLCWI